ncbi:FkbM family methyltransferase [Patescibacteria group bacterium]|nr:FkbM family methyltransferase [Patescibacteria group bacterium]MBU4390051.1 FkbM family methyltransferase [Patescibacteria group bacterium]MBU4431283.1 FkbM family methyltransferase [Patescibacteria group bacterium]MBU4578545.1 FkbM family methyltransferase [Patescibacteria group bacterium]
MKKIFYYLQTLFVLFTNIKHPTFSLSKLFFNQIFHTSKNTTIVLKDKTKFQLRNIMDLWVLTETYLKKDYEVFGIKIKKNWIIIDIGAGVGDFSIFAAKKSKSNTIYAIEPFFESCKLLQKNITQNKIKNIFTNNLAIATNNNITLNINSSNFLNTRTIQEVGIERERERERVKSMPLSKYFQVNKIKTCNLLKCDCEGAEFDIFLNLNKETYQKIENIIMEYHLFNPTNKLKDLINTFSKNGFKIKTHPNPIHNNIGFLFATKN